MNPVARFEPADPDFAERTRGNFAKQGFMRFLDVVMTAINPGDCQLELLFRDDLSQQHGFFHGGVVATLADVSGGYAAFSLFPADKTILTVEFKLNLLAPGIGERLVARATVIKAGRTLTVCQSDVFCVTDGEEEKLCGTALATYMAVSRV